MKYLILLFFLSFSFESFSQSSQEIKLDYYFNGYKIVDGGDVLTAAFFLRNDTILLKENWRISNLDSFISMGVSVLGQTAIFENIPISRFKDHARIDIMVYQTHKFKKAPKGYLKKYNTKFKRKSRKHAYVTTDGKEYVIRKGLNAYNSVIIIKFFHQTDDYISGSLIGYVYFVK